MDFSKLPQLHPVSLRDENNSWRDIDWIPLIGRLIIAGVIWGFAFLVILVAYGGCVLLLWTAHAVIPGFPA